MILQNSVHYERNLSFVGCWNTIWAQVRLVLSTIGKVKKFREQEILCAHLNKLSQKQLIDIGYDDPQVQIRLLGRYLDSGVASRGYVENFRGGSAGSAWYY